jgi:radical SAM protein with 4Fe4S-binding SPASM domain
MHVDTLKFYKYSPVKKPEYKGKFCRIPFDTLQIDEDGDVQLCDCQFHMPYTIGNIYQDTLTNIWLSNKADLVRQSVIDEDFAYCHTLCAHLYKLPNRPATLPNLPNFPKTIKIDLDRSCNLKCPSCRENVIIEKNSTKIDKQIELFAQIKQWGIDNPNVVLKIMPMTSGEIFASHSGLQFLKSLVDYPYNNLKIEITSNGTLLNKNQELIKSISHLISSIAISIDAGTPETYAVVRGGDWDELMLGLEFIKDTIDKSLTFKFCIQKNNYHEIESFADLADKFGAKINYQKLMDWGHWSIDWWDKNTVLEKGNDTLDAVVDSIKRTQMHYPNQVSLAADIITYLE